MKKNYSSPQTTVVKLAAMQLLTVSMDANRNYGSGEGITLGSRSDNSWDDDED